MKVKDLQGTINACEVGFADKSGMVLRFHEDTQFDEYFLNLEVIKIEFNQPLGSSGHTYHKVWLNW